MTKIEQQYKQKVSLIVSANPQLKQSRFHYVFKFLEFQKLVFTELDKANKFAFETKDKMMESAISKVMKKIEVISLKLKKIIQNSPL